MRAGLAAALALVLLLPGCGDGDDSATGGGDLPAAGGGGELAYAVPRFPRSLDPLLAADRSAQTVSRQVHEPLVARLSGPYGETNTHPGLVTSLTPRRIGRCGRRSCAPG